MRNIREEKGYTYGIGASMQSFLHEGAMHITTDTAHKYVEATKQEIYKELERLREEQVPVEELDQVRNYLQGALLTGIDSPFALARLLKRLILYGLTYEYYQTFLHHIKTIEPGELQELAQQYFQADKLYEIVAGKRS
jgi:predicted Zn-dependent peptidase